MTKTCDDISEPKIVYQLHFVHYNVLAEINSQTH